MRILLDTHIILFSNSGKLSDERIKILENDKNELFVAQISLWEITKLYELKRIVPERSLEYLLMSIYHHPKYNLVDINPGLLLKLVNISPKMHKDPADQLIVASALSVDAVLMTNDQEIKNSKLITII